MTIDDRVTWGLIGEVLDVLERHGYHRYDNRHTAQAVGAIADLADLYQGTRDLSYDTYLYQPPPAPDAGPGPTAPEADEAVIVTDAEASTIAAALDIAAGHHRDRAAACAGCPDRTCPTCQSQLRDAQAYSQMAAQMRQTAQAARTAGSAQPEPGGPPVSPRHPHPAADKEAGQ
jgi:hypothetical protein